jgi:hypothetical protein
MVFTATCSRVLLEKLIVAHLVEKIPAIYGTLRFITLLSKPYHWNL